MEPIPDPPTQDLCLPAGASRIRLRIEVPEDACLTVELEARAPGGKLLSRQFLAVGVTSPVFQRSGWYQGLSRFFLPYWRSLSSVLPSWLAWLSLSLYLLVRLVGLDSFPIYFFTDEAVQTVQAADFLTNYLHGSDREFLPAYFVNGSQYNLGISVYLQVLPYFLFGKSVWVTRGIATLMTLIAAASVGLTLNKIFKSASPWLAILFLSITPTWFLHSRTAFETTLAASFYAAFLYCYLMYRIENPRWLYGAVVLAALAFYSYNPMRVIITVTGALLLITDLRYHLRRPKTLLAAFGLALLLAMPFARHLINHPDAAGWQMRLLGSYWLAETPLIEKLGVLAGEYLRGLDPLYWYLPNSVDLPRHLMLNYGHLLRQTIPLGLLGILLALRRIGDPRYRVLLIAVLAAPSGAALVHIGITRMLVMVIPMAILTALAAQWILDWLHLRWRLPRVLLSVSMFILLAGANLYMLNDALVRGPGWFKDYGLNGMQWGAQQVFGEVSAFLQQDPEARVVMSPSWANGTDVVARFFFPDPLPFELASPAGFFDASRPLDDHTLLVITPEEYQQIPRTRFADVRVEKTLDYPNGMPGFYFVRLKYIENVNEVIAAEERLHRRPLMKQVRMDGEAVDITYPRFDMGTVEDLIDGNPETLARTWAINPMDLSFDFLTPRAVQGINLRLGGAPTTLQLKIWTDEEDAPLEITRSLPGALIHRDVSLDFPRAVRAARLWISIKNSADSSSGAVHLWEISFK